MYRKEQHIYFDISQVTGEWEQKTKLSVAGGSNAEFGSSVAITGTDNSAVAIIGSYGWGGGVGAAYIFDISLDTGEWNPTEKHIFVGSGLNNYFGRSVDIVGHRNSGSAIVGQNGIFTSTGNATIYDFSSVTGDWEEMATLVATDAATNDNFGYSVSIAEIDNSAVAIIGAYTKDASGRFSIYI